MQLKLNCKNSSVACVGLFFLWLLYALWRTKDTKIVDLVSIDLKELIDYSILAVERGGYAVEKIYNEQNLFVKSKGKTAEGADEVLTQADVVSHMLIYETLQRLPGIREKIISEENAARLLSSDLEQYKLNNYDVWLSNQGAVKDIPSAAVPLSSVTIWVDPLDATQEFAEGLSQYVSVMICIAVDGKPRFGVIHRPFLHETVWGLVGYGTHPKSPAHKPSSKIKTEGEIGEELKVQPSNAILVSRSHAGQVRQILDKIDMDRRSSRFVIEPAGGAGYKSLRVLNGTGYAYVHTTAIKKWDICAADAVIRAAGGRVTTLNGDDLTYFSKDEVVVDKGILVTMHEHFQLLAQLKNASSV